MTNVQVAPYPNFYFEAAESIGYLSEINPSATGSQRIWGHPLWKLPNVVPEICISINNVGQNIYNGTASGLASGFIHEYFYNKNNFALGGVTLGNYSLKISQLGVHRGSLPYDNLFNNIKDMTTGAVNSGAVDFNQPFFVPWASSGIAYYTHPTGFLPFWAELKSKMTASGIPNFQLLAMTSEDFGDDSSGLLFGATGWVNRALADPRSTGILFDGVRTFSQFWNTPMAWPIDNSIVPTGVTNAGQRAPENALVTQKWQAARIMGNSYAKLKGIVEPMQTTFATGIPMAEYAVFAANAVSPASDFFPNFPRCLIDKFFHPWQGPDFYGAYLALHNGSEDGVPPYWDSDLGWQTVYNKFVINPDHSFSPKDFTSLQWGESRLANCVTSFPDHPACPWLSMVSTSGNPDLFFELIKYCYAKGIRNFYVFEGNGVGTRSEHDGWYSLISRVNNYIDSLPINGGSNQNSIGGIVNKMGNGGYYKR